MGFAASHGLTGALFFVERQLTTQKALLMQWPMIKLSYTLTQKCFDTFWPMAEA